jgi:hypothetical protein
MMDVRAMRGAYVGSDHHLVLCKLRLKLKRSRKGKAEQLFDSIRLKIPEEKERFTTELKNRFEVLESVTADDIDSLSANIQRTFLETSQEVLGYKKRGRKEYISQDT